MAVTYSAPPKDSCAGQKPYWNPDNPPPWWLYCIAYVWMELWTWKGSAVIAWVLVLVLLMQLLVASTENYEMRLFLRLHLGKEWHAFETNSRR